MSATRVSICALPGCSEPIAGHILNPKGKGYPATWFCSGCLANGEGEKYVDQKDGIKPLAPACLSNDNLGQDYGSFDIDLGDA